MIKTIIFDFGGVMINDRSSDATLTQALQNLPTEVRNHHQEILIQSELGRVPYANLLEADKLLFPEKTAEEVKDFFFNTEVYQPFYLAEKLLTNYQVIVFSNNHIGVPEEVAKILKIDISKFPFINSALVGMRKPEKKFYIYLLEKYSLNANECLFIDNTHHNLIPAEELGIKTFHYSRDDKKFIKFLKDAGLQGL